MKLGIFIGGFIVIWALVLKFLGMNIFSIVFGIFASCIWFAIWGGIAQGITEYKRDTYLANKYDEEKKKGK